MAKQRSKAERLMAELGSLPVSLSKIVLIVQRTPIAIEFWYVKRKVLHILLAQVFPCLQSIWYTYRKAAGGSE